MHLIAISAELAFQVPNFLIHIWIIHKTLIHFVEIIDSFYSGVTVRVSCFCLVLCWYLIELVLELAIGVDTEVKNSFKLSVKYGFWA